MDHGTSCSLSKLLKTAVLDVPPEAYLMKPTCRVPKNRRPKNGTSLPLYLAGSEQIFVQLSEHAELRVKSSKLT